MAAALLIATGGCGAGAREVSSAPSGPPVSQSVPPSVPSVPGVTGSDTAAAFADFAAGRVESAPFAPEVGLYVGGRVAGVLDRGAATRVRSWRTCPAGEQTYSMVACPVSAVDTLASAQERGEVLLTQARVPAVVGCVAAGPVDGLDASRVVVLRAPTARQNCFEDFAVSLYLDPDDRIAAVDYVISSP